MSSARVLILYNEPVLPPGHPEFDSEHEIVGTTAAVRRSLSEAEFGVAVVGVRDDPSALLDALRDHSPDVVVNLFEGTARREETEAYVAGLLEWLDIPFTGCPSRTLSLARDKAQTKHLLKGAGLPTPGFFLIQDEAVPRCPLAWPVIVKPANQDASVGLDHGSVVTGQPQLLERVAALLRTYGPPVLVEEYIGGREFNVGVVEAPELRVLPISEIEFAYADAGSWPIVTYDAKWQPESRDFRATPPRCPADVEPQLAERLSRLATAAYRLLGCRDYARVDFRVREPDQAYILEVNPNPDLSPAAGLANALACGGVGYADFVVQMVRHALARGKRGTGANG
jgi:D-alanine-D-alanine ligase